MIPRTAGPSFLRGFLALLLPFLAVLPARAQQVTLSGWFHVVWEDAGRSPVPDGQRFFLVDGTGRSFELALDEADLRAVGGARAIDRQRVVVTAREAPQRATGPATTPVLDVLSIRPEGSALPSAAALAAPQSGSKPYVTILCRFADSATVLPKSRYDAWMGSSYPSMDPYWREVSGGQINTVGSVVVGWFTLPQPYSYYVTNKLLDLSKAFNDCTSVADASVYFPQYAGINLQFNTWFDYSWGGGYTATLDGQTRSYGTTWLANWAGQSVYAHEMGHSLGLPHSSGPYGQTYDSNWDVMSNAYVYYDAAYSSYVAQHTIAYHKDMLGWIPAGRKYVAAQGSSQTITLERSALPGTGGYLMAQVPISGTNDFYTVEARRTAGYDRGIPGEAVVLHRVTPTAGTPARVVDPDGNGNPNDDGAAWYPGETFTDAQAGITISVASTGATGFQVAITNGSAPVTVSITSDAQRPAGRVGTPYSDGLQATGGNGAITWSVTGGGLPPGLALSSAGVVAGTPGQAGTFQYTATASSGGASASRTFTVTIAPQFVVTSAGARPAGVVGTAYADTLQVGGAPGPVAWATTGGALPPGLALSAAGVVSGTPTQAGSFGFTVTAASGGLAASRDLTLTVYDPVTVATDSVRATGVVGTPYADRLQARGGTGTYGWSVKSGSLPPGLSLDAATGAVAGTPTQAGTFRFSAAATSAGLVGSGPFVVTVYTPVSIVSDTARPGGMMGRSYADTLVAQGGSGTAAWRIGSGALPEGVTLSAAGVVSGIPAEAGTFRFSAVASTGTLSAARSFTLVVGKPTLRVEAVIDQLLGTGTLSADEARYLDLQGNRNGRVDLGDVRAWMIATGAVSPVRIPGLEDLTEGRRPAQPAPGTREHVNQERER